MQSVFPDNMVALSDSQARVAADVAAVTGGALTLRMLPVGAMAAPGDLLDAVIDGRIHAGWDWLGYRAETMPLAGVVASYPYGPSPLQLAGWLYDGGGLALLEQAYAAHDLVPIPCHMVIAEAAGWFRREITTPEDFQGLRIRIAGLGAKVLERLGAEPTAEPVGDLFEALSAGRLDAVEFSVPVVDQSFGFGRFASYYYFPGWHQPASPIVLTVNGAVWDSLPAPQKAAVRTVCRGNMMVSMAEAERLQMRALDTFRERGVVVRRFTYSVLKRLQAVSREVLAEEAARDPLVAKAVQSMQDYIDENQRWTSLQHLPP